MQFWVPFILICTSCLNNTRLQITEVSESVVWFAVVLSSYCFLFQSSKMMTLVWLALLAAPALAVDNVPTCQCMEYWTCVLG